MNTARSLRRLSEGFSQTGSRLTSKTNQHCRGVDRTVPLETNRGHHRAGVNRTILISRTKLSDSTADFVADCLNVSASTGSFPLSATTAQTKEKDSWFLHTAPLSLKNSHYILWEQVITAGWKSLQTTWLINSRWSFSFCQRSVEALDGAQMDEEASVSC